MGHLRVATLLLLLPRIVWTQAPAATAAGANPLLSLNVPNLANILGNLLGGNMFNGGGFGSGMVGFGNMLGFGSMLGLFNHHNNLFYNQLFIHGLIGMTLLKLTIFALLFGTLLTGGLIIKLAVVAMVLTLGRYGHYDPHHYYRRDYRTIGQHSDPWSSKRISPDNSLLWNERKIRT